MFNSVRHFWVLRENPQPPIQAFEDLLPNQTCEEIAALAGPCRCLLTSSAQLPSKPEDRAGEGTRPSGVAPSDWVL